MKTLLSIVMLLVGFRSIYANTDSSVKEEAFDQSHCKSYGESIEVLSLKCDTQSLGYILGSLYNREFRILGVICKYTEEPKWVIKYCKPMIDLEDPI
jgi:hypothetical protein